VFDALRLDVVRDVCAVGTQGAAQWTCKRQTSGLHCHDHVHAAYCAVKHAGCQSAVNMPGSWQRTVKPFRYLCPGKVRCQAHKTAFFITGRGVLGRMEELTSSSGDIEQGGHAGIEVVGGAALHQPDTCLVQHCVLLVHAARDELQRLLSLALHM
jgi:hypothetical protein